MDTGYKIYNHKLSNRKMKPYSNKGLNISPIDLFLPSHSEDSWKDYQQAGLLHYKVGGVDVVTLDPGFYTDISNPYRKQEFSAIAGLSSQCIVMVYGGIYPSCARSKYDFNVKEFKKEWKHILDSNVGYPYI